MRGRWLRLSEHAARRRQPRWLIAMGHHAWVSGTSSGNALGLRATLGGRPLAGEAMSDKDGLGRWEAGGEAKGANEWMR